MHMSHRWRRTLIPVLFAFLLLSSETLVPAPVTKAALVSDATAQGLADRFKPVLFFEQGEKVFPVNVEYYLQFCNLNQSLGSNVALVIPAPLTPDLLIPYTDPARTSILTILSARSRTTT